MKKIYPLLILALAAVGCGKQIPGTYSGFETISVQNGRTIQNPVTLKVTGSSNSITGGVYSLDNTQVRSFTGRLNSGSDQTINSVYMSTAQQSTQVVGFNDFEASCLISTPLTGTLTLDSNGNNMKGSMTTYGGNNACGTVTVSYDVVRSN